MKHFAFGIEMADNALTVNTVDYKNHCKRDQSDSVVLRHNYDTIMGDAVVGSSGIILIVWCYLACS